MLCDCTRKTHDLLHPPSLNPPLDPPEFIGPLAAGCRARRRCSPAPLHPGGCRKAGCHTAAIPHGKLSSRNVDNLWQTIAKCGNVLWQHVVTFVHLKQTMAESIQGICGPSAKTLFAPTPSGSR